MSGMRSHDAAVTSAMANKAEIAARGYFWGRVDAVKGRDSEKPVWATREEAFVRLFVGRSPLDWGQLEPVFDEFVAKTERDSAVTS